MKQFVGFIDVKTEKTRKSMEGLLRWKARKINKLMKNKLRKSKSDVGCAFSALQLLKMQVIDFLFKATLCNPKWSQNDPKMEPEIEVWKARFSMRTLRRIYKTLASQDPPQGQGSAAGARQPAPR